MLPKNQLNKVYDSTLLTQSNVYQIDGCSYRYLGRDPYASIKSPKYRFKPLPGSKKRSDISLNHKQLMLKVYQVEGMRVTSSTTATDNSVQMGLF